MARNSFSDIILRQDKILNGQHYMVSAMKTHRKSVGVAEAATEQEESTLLIEAVPLGQGN